MNLYAGSGAPLDVVVPARDEGALVGACVRGVLAGAEEVDVRVLVVANGCSDDTAERARAAGAEVFETPVPGKAAALNAGLRRCREESAVVFLDADTVLTPGTTRALSMALDTPLPRLVSPRPLLVRPTGLLARGYSEVWSRLPGVTDDVVGAGCYAVSAAGRARWSVFPPLVADDAYVRMLFQRHEREVLSEGAFLLVLPEGRELVRVVRRWRDGNAALPDSPSVSTGGNLRAVVRSPRLWPYLPAFAGVLAMSRLRKPDLAWARAEKVREVGRPAPGYTLVVDPEVEAAADARAQLAALAARFPDARLYGAALGGPIRRGTPIGVALVDTLLWRNAGKPATVAQLFTRASGPGVTPMITPLARFRFTGRRGC
ncbi:glycosyltransferase [Actinokineospora auranticolor]|uniref:4,4'-diaponeurosporenoate glycosyltransferase n=1 Tax=Actinokineospora auranticolor TaxID=155976 RepID=A0A2S6GMQ4_9PSEU|nr:glycosyltransferase [Actinokineospora auranticolor]PPK66453.1 glycosyltransferase involved in cell wall biosynthesis [Actinokineospora auranticolor]